MMPSGIHINKSAIAVIVVLFIIIFIGFKYKYSSDTDIKSIQVFDPSQVKEGFANEDEREEYLKKREKEIEKLTQEKSTKEDEEEEEEKESQKSKQIKQEETKNKEELKSKKVQQKDQIPDWKTVKLDSLTIPDEIESAVGRMKVIEKTYKVMDIEIYARRVIPEVICKGGVLLLHGKMFSSQIWEDIKTLQYIGAMGYTPVAVDLPGYGKTPKTLSNTSGFLEQLIKAINFTAPVIISPSMSGQFSMPYLFDDPKTAIKRSHGFVPVAPVGIDKYAEKFKETQIPAALVYGQKDKSFKESVEKTLSTLPNSRLFMLEGAKHPAYLDRPGEWHKILYVFLNAAFK